MGTQGERIRNIQALRALAALLVVARHVQVYVERIVGGPPWLGRFQAGDMGVDLFFVISGYILIVNQRETFTRGADAARFLYRRAVRIYPLYWIYSLPALAIFWWRPRWLHRLDYGMPVHLGRSFLLWPQEGWPLLGQAWSLVYEVYFYLVFAGLMFLPGKFFRRGLLAWAGVVVAGGFLLAAHPALERPESGLIFSALTLEFIAGALVGLALRGVTARRGGALAGWLALGLSAYWIARVVLPLGLPLTALDRVLDYGLPCVLLVGGAVLLEGAGVRPARFLTVIGDWSYSIYLSHIFVIAALVHVLPDRAPTRLAETGLAILLVAAVLLVGAVSYHVLEGPLSRLTRWERAAGRSKGRGWLAAGDAAWSYPDQAAP